MTPVGRRPMVLRPRLSSGFALSRRKGVAIQARLSHLLPEASPKLTTPVRYSTVRRELLSGKRPRRKKPLLGKRGRGSQQGPQKARKALKTEESERAKARPLLLSARRSRRR